MQLDRYIRQIRYARLGEAGQRRLCQSSVLVCGCGALGNLSAAMLVRAGVGQVRIVDRDFAETTNLQRQLLFDEDDVAQGLPKAVAAAQKLARANPEVHIEPIVADITAANIEKFSDGIHLIVDATDNFETRFLINDLAVKRGIAWVYGGCLGAEGQTMTIVPGQTACLRCLMPECPPPGSTPTCDVAGILAPVVGVIASIQVIEAIKILSGNLEAISRKLTVVELWDGEIRQFDVSQLRDQIDCPTCKRGDFAWLSGRETSRPSVLCGRNAVQLSLPAESIPLEDLARRLGTIGPVLANPYLVKLKVENLEITVFGDGRTIVTGTDDIALAKTVVAKYIGL